MPSQSSAKRARKTYHHHNLAPTLLRAAEILLEKEGLAMLSLREVARKAGVSHNAPYRHFQDRDALLLAMADEGFARLRQRMEDAGANSEEQQGTRLAFGRAYVLFALEHPQLFRLMFSGLRSSSDNPQLLKSSSAAFETLAKTFPATPAEMPTGAVKAWALVHGVALLLLERQLVVPSGTKVETFIDALLSHRD